jgi:hypothetical protein
VKNTQDGTIGQWRHSIPQPLEVMSVFQQVQAAYESSTSSKIRQASRWAVVKITKRTVFVETQRVVFLAIGPASKAFCPNGITTRKRLIKTRQMGTARETQDHIPTRSGLGDRSELNDKPKRTRRAVQKPRHSSSIVNFGLNRGIPLE